MTSTAATRPSAIQTHPGYTSAYLQGWEHHTVLHRAAACNIRRHCVRDALRVAVLVSSDLVVVLVIWLAVRALRSGMVSTVQMAAVRPEDSGLGIPLIELTAPRLALWQVAAKRLIDIVAASVGLILMSPAFAVLAVLIRLDSPGPIFFRQWRVGRRPPGGRPNAFL